MLKQFWYVAAASREVTDKPLARTIMGEKLVLFRTSNGEVACLADVCPHRRAPLSLGRVIDDAIACPYHGVRLDRDGACVHIPTQARIPQALSTRSYATVERYGMIWLWPGEDSDLTMFPALPWRESDDWNSAIVQHMKVQAPAQLIVNNLLDLSHVAFVHEATIGFPPEQLADDPLVVETIDDEVVRCTRAFHNVDPPPTHRAWRDFAGKVDRTSIAEWRPPGAVSILVRNEDPQGAIDLRFDHFMTPETAETHHYFVAISRNFEIGDDAMTARLDIENAKVHEEDRFIVEAQFANMRAHPDTREIPLQQDQAIARTAAIMTRVQAES